MRLEDGRVAYGYGAYFDLIGRFWKNQIPVSRGNAADPPDEQDLFGNGARYRAEHSWGAYGTDAGQSTDEDIWFQPDRSVRVSSTTFVFAGKVLTKYEGSWFAEDGWVMLHLKHGIESSEGEGTGTVSTPMEDTVLYLEWRSDLGGFLKSEDATRIDGGGFRLNTENHRFELETEKEFDNRGYFTAEWVK
jgi:hypothetical protein